MLGRQQQPERLFHTFQLGRHAAPYRWCPGSELAEMPGFPWALSETERLVFHPALPDPGNACRS